MFHAQWRLSVVTFISVPVTLVICKVRSSHLFSRHGELASLSHCATLALASSHVCSGCRFTALTTGN